MANGDKYKPSSTIPLTKDKREILKRFYNQPAAQEIVIEPQGYLHITVKANYPNGPQHPERPLLLKKASVTIDKDGASITQETNSDGEVLFGPLRIGTYAITNVTCDATDTFTYEAPSAGFSSIEVTNKKVGRGEAVLDAKPTSLKVKVTCEDVELPPGVKAKITGRGNGVRKEPQQVTNGETIFQEVKEGKYDVEVTCPNTETHAFEVDKSKQEPAEVIVGRDDNEHTVALIAKATTIKVKVMRLGTREVLAETKVSLDGPVKYGPIPIENDFAVFSNIKVQDGASYTIKATCEDTEDFKFEEASRVVACSTLQVGIDNPEEIFQKVIPAYFYDFKIYDDRPQPQLVSGIDYVLRVKKSGNQEWEDVEEGTLKGEKVYDKFVPEGRYQLTLKIVSEVEWSKPKITIGEEVDLKAKVTGFKEGTAGVFKIFDLVDSDQALHTIQATVADNKLEATWTPAEAQLGTLKSGNVVFSAKVGNAQSFSPPVRVFKKQRFDLEDHKGVTVSTRLIMHFAGGERIETRGGEDVRVPWGATPSLINLPDQENTRVRIKDDYPERAFMV